MASEEWIHGVFFAFKWVNSRCNTSSDFDFFEIENCIPVESAVLKKLSNDANNLQVSVSPIDEPLETLSSTLHGWLFIYMGVDGSRRNNDAPRLIDESKHFRFTDRNSQIEFCKNFASNIIEFCEPDELYSIRLQADENYLSFGSCYVFRNRSKSWFLRLGEYF